jgi:hypothetical protein
MLATKLLLRPRSASASSYQTHIEILPALLSSRPTFHFLNPVKLSFPDRPSRSTVQQTTAFRGHIGRLRLCDTIHCGAPRRPRLSHVSPLLCEIAEGRDLHSSSRGSLGSLMPFYDINDPNLGLLIEVRKYLVA